MSVRKSLRCFSILLAAVCTLPLCTGCSIPFLEQEESDGSGYLFTASLAANPKSLDPQSATDAASKTIIENLYEGLVELDENGSPQLAAAENYTVSPDGLTYTFTLKSDRFWFYDANADDVVDDDEKWQVTADDYVYAFQRIFDPQTQSPLYQHVLLSAKCRRGAERTDGTGGDRCPCRQQYRATIFPVPSGRRIFQQSRLHCRHAVQRNLFPADQGQIRTRQGFCCLLRGILSPPVVLRPLRQPEPDLHASQFCQRRSTAGIPHQSDIPDSEKQR